MNKLASSSSNLPSLRFIKRRSRQGLTLIELLIAVGLTLVIVAAMIRAFKTSSESISLGRTKMDMHNKIRVVSEQLRRDLQNATHIPHPRASTSEGYFEIVEGDETDGDHATTQQSFIGDHDDVLALTVRSEGEPFRGRWVNDQGTTSTADDVVQYVESYVAEVIWWVVHLDGDDYDGQYRLYRRALLIRPDLTSVTSQTVGAFFEANDISAHPESGILISNTLEDLADRKNRYAHDRAIFPHEMQSGQGAQRQWLRERVLGELNDAAGNYDDWADPDRLGEDLMLDHCVSFDIKVFDPTAEVFIPSEVGLSVGQVIDWDDPGFNDVISTYPPAVNLTAYPQNGAYVNLGYDPWSFDVNGDYDTRIFDVDRWFSSRPWPINLPRTNPALAYKWEANTWCTWWEGYESDGLDQDNSGDIDQGVDGIDNNSDGIIDDNEERETRPPYAYPIRSLEIRIRMIEKKSNLILQKTVRESFVPN